MKTEEGFIIRIHLKNLKEDRFLHGFNKVRTILYSGKVWGGFESHPELRAELYTEEKAQKVVTELRTKWKGMGIADAEISVHNISEYSVTSSFIDTANVSLVKEG